MCPLCAACDGMLLPRARLGISLLCPWLAAVGQQHAGLQAPFLCRRCQAGRSCGDCAKAEVRQCLFTGPIRAVSGCLGGIKRGQNGVKQYGDGWSQERRRDKGRDDGDEQKAAGRAEAAAGPAPEPLLCRLHRRGCRCQGQLGLHQHRSLPLHALRGCPQRPRHPHLKGDPSALTSKLSLGHSTSISTGRRQSESPRERIHSSKVSIHHCESSLWHQVRSCTLDTWLPEQVAFMAQTGNDRANQYFEAKLERELKPAYGSVDLERFIRRKVGTNPAHPPAPGSRPCMHTRCNMTSETHVSVTVCSQGLR